jgi:hypothetical protein
MPDCTNRRVLNRAKRQYIPQSDFARLGETKKTNKRADAQPQYVCNPNENNINEEYRAAQTEQSQSVEAEQTAVDSPNESANDTADEPSSYYGARSRTDDLAPRAGTPTLDVQLDGVSAGANAAIKYGAPQVLSVIVADVAGIANKQVEITIPEGLTLVDYPGMNGTPLPENMTGFVTLGSEPAIIKDSENNESRFGTLIYNLETPTDGVKFDITVAVDQFKIYALSALLQNPITVVLKGSDASLPITRNINITVTADSLSRTFYNNSDTIVMYVPLDTAVNSRSTTFTRRMSGQSISDVPKSAVVTFTLPANAVLDGVYYNASRTPNGTVPPEDIANLYTGTTTNAAGKDHITVNGQTVKLYYENTRPYSVYLKIHFTSGNPGTNYDIRYQVTTTEYDGTTHTNPASPGVFSRFRLQSASNNRLEVTGASVTASTELDGVPLALTTVGRVVFKNTTADPVTNQIIRYDFPTDLHVRAFEFPHTTATPISVTYGVFTNANPPNVVERTITDGTLLSTGTKRMLFSSAAASLNLAPGEFVKYAYANVGTLPVGFDMTTSSAATSGCMIYGNIDDGTPPTTYKTDVTLSSADDANAAVTASSVVTVATGRSSYLIIIPTVTPNAAGKYMFAPGDDIHVMGDIEVASTTSFYGALGNIQTIKDPVAFIILPDGVDLDTGSVTLTQDGANVPFTLDLPESMNDGTGRYFVRVHIQGVVGLLRDDGKYWPYIYLNYDMVPRLDAPSSTFVPGDLLYITTNNSDETVPTAHTGYTAVPDTNDISGDGTAKLLIRKNTDATTIVINEFPEDMRINSGGQHPDDSGSVTYDPTNPATIVTQTSGSDFVYDARFVNTLASAAGRIEAYIPVPKKDKSYGSYFQSAPFTFSMALTGPPSATRALADYTITYTTDNITNTNYDTAAYRTAAQINTDNDWANVTMIRVERASIPAGTDDHIKFTFKTTDTTSEVITPTNDIFHPYYYVDAGGVQGWRPGQDVAASYQSGAVAGTLFRDTNKNGKMDAGEPGIDGQIVRMRLPATGDGANYGEKPTVAGVSTYTDPVTGVKYAQTVTKADGTYLFPAVPAVTPSPYTLTFSNPNNYDYKFTTQDTADVQTGSDVNAAGVTGVVDELDLAASKYVNAGVQYLQYSVTYNKNDGSGDTTTVQVDRPDTNVGSLPTPPSTACNTFAGWFTAPSGGKQFTAGTTVDEDTNVYAHWTLLRYTVNYALDGNQTSGSVPMAHTNVGCGSDVTPKSNTGNLKRTGYDMIGWNTVMDSAVPLTSLDNVTGNATLYPVWQKKTYTIIIDPNGGKGPAGSINMQIGGTAALPPFGGYVLPCYRCVGFSTSASATSPNYTTSFTLDAAAIIRLMANDTKSTLTLYATYAEDTHTVFSLNPVTENLVEEDPCDYPPKDWDIVEILDFNMRKVCNNPPTP